MKRLTLLIASLWTVTLWAPPGALDIRYHWNMWRNFDPPRPACRILKLSPKPDGTLDFCSYPDDDDSVALAKKSLQASMAKTNYVTLPVQQSNPNLRIRQDPDNGNSWEILLDDSGNEVPQPCN